MILEQRLPASDSLDSEVLAEPPNVACDTHETSVRKEVVVPVNSVADEETEVKSEMVSGGDNVNIISADRDVDKAQVQVQAKGSASPIEVPAMTEERGHSPSGKEQEEVNHDQPHAVAEAEIVSEDVEGDTKSDTTEKAEFSSSIPTRGSEKEGRFLPTIFEETEEECVEVPEEKLDRASTLKDGENQKEHKGIVEQGDVVSGAKADTKETEEIDEEKKYVNIFKFTSLTSKPKDLLAFKKRKLEVRKKWIALIEDDTLEVEHIEMSLAELELAIGKSRKPITSVKISQGGAGDYNYEAECSRKSKKSDAEDELPLDMLYPTCSSSGISLTQGTMVPSLYGDGGGDKSQTCSNLSLIPFKVSYFVLIIYL